VRLVGCLLVESLVAAGLVTGAGYATGRVASVFVGAMGRRAAPAADLSGGKLLPRGEISNPPDPATVEEPAPTFLGMADDILLDRLRTQPISRIKVKGGGSSLSFRIDFADGSRAAWKPAQTNVQTVPRKEVAAYRLNRLLGLNAVPPAAPRVIARDELFARLAPESAAAIPRINAETVFDPSGKTLGAASYWIPEIRDSDFDTPDGRRIVTSWLTVGQPIPPDKRAMAAQLSNLAVFDFLTSNADRYSGGNMKVSPDGTRLWFMDNTMAFSVQPDGNETTRPVLQRTQRFSRRLYGALDRVDVVALQRAIEDEPAHPYEILTAAEIRAVVARRQVVKRHIEQLAAQYGAKNVLAFP